MIKWLPYCFLAPSFSASANNANIIDIVCALWIPAQTIWSNFSGFCSSQSNFSRILIKIYVCGIWIMIKGLGMHMTNQMRCYLWQWCLLFFYLHHTVLDVAFRKVACPCQTGDNLEPLFLTICALLKPCEVPQCPCSVSNYNAVNSSGIFRLQRQACGATRCTFVCQIKPYFLHSSDVLV